MYLATLPGPWYSPILPDANRLEQLARRGTLQDKLQE